MFTAQRKELQLRIYSVTILLRYATYFKILIEKSGNIGKCFPIREESKVRFTQ